MRLCRRNLTQTTASCGIQVKPQPLGEMLERMRVVTLQVAPTCFTGAGPSTGESVPALPLQLWPESAASFEAVLLLPDSAGGLRSRGVFQRCFT